MPTFIESEIRRTNRNLLATHAIVVVLIGCFAALSSRYLRNFFGGPYPADRDFLGHVTRPCELDHYFVTVEGGRLVDTGWRETHASSRSSSPPSVTAYSLLYLGDRALIVESPGKRAIAATAASCTGAIVTLPESTRGGVVASLRQSNPGIGKSLYPFMLDVSSFKQAGLLLFPPCVLMLAIATWNLARWWIRRTNPATHPVVRELERFGSFEDVATGIELEVESGCTRIGSTRLTRSWLLRSDATTLKAFKLDDVLWAYGAWGRQSALVLHTRDRGGLRLQDARKSIEKILSELETRIPWAVFDYDKKWVELWKQGVDAFAAVVDERRQKRSAAREVPVGAS